MYNKTFEDEFMDIQSSLVSLTLELLEKTTEKVDKIYIYIFQNEFQTFPNAFFSKANKIIRLDNLFDDDLIDNWFDCCVEDVDKIINICKNYDRNCPNEFKLIYDINTKAFDSKYKYDDVVTNEDGNLVDIYNDWIKECKNNLSN